MLRALCTVAVVVGAAFASATQWSWTAGATAVYQNADRADGGVTASADLTLDVTHGGGSWFVYLEASSRPGDDSVAARYPSANGDAGSVVDGTGGGVQISELHYTFDLTGGAALLVGLVDATAWLDATAISNDETAHFVNASLVNNATIEFPDYTVGALYTRPGLMAIVTRSAGLADFDNRRYERLLDPGDPGRGVFAAIEGQWTSGPMSAGLGAWLRSDDHAVAGAPGRTDPNFGAYATWQWADGPDAIDARLGFANGEVSEAGRFAALAYTRQTAFGVLGAGVAHTGLSSDFDGARRDDRLDAEVFFRFSLADGALAVTPSVQRIVNPGFDASGAIRDARATVVGVRFNWAFSSP